MDTAKVKKPTEKKRSAPKSQKTKKSAAKKPATTTAVAVVDRVYPPADAKVLDVAQRQHEKIVAMAGQISKKWSDLGLELRDFQENKRWEPLGFKSLNAWIADVAEELGFKRSTFYDVVTTAKKLAELPAEDVRAMPRENAKELARLPESERKALVPAAKSDTHREFRKKVKAQEQGAAKERNVQLAFSVPSSLADMYEEEAAPVAAWIGETEIRAEQFECIVVQFLDAPCEHPDALESETNRQAYNRLHPKAEKAKA